MSTRPRGGDPSSVVLLFPCLGFLEFFLDWERVLSYKDFKDLRGKLLLVIYRQYKLNLIDLLTEKINAFEGFLTHILDQN